MTTIEIKKKTITTNHIQITVPAITINYYYSNDRYSGGPQWLIRLDGTWCRTFHTLTEALEHLIKVQAINNKQHNEILNKIKE